MNFLILLFIVYIMPMNSFAISITEEIYQLKTPLDEILYPEIKPYNQGYLKVSAIHSIWYGEYGNPNGVPVLFIHGGPGGGTDDTDAKYFDPSYYRIILFDQRGTMKSKPFAEIKDNTPQDAVNDIEKLRQHLKIDKWILFGGSYGSFLSIFYGEHHPERCLGFVLRGIFLGTQPEFEHIWYGMQDVFPETWDEFQKFLPESERNDLIQSYYKRLIDTDPKIHMAAAHSFIKYDMSAAYLMQDNNRLKSILTDEKLVLGCAKIFTHYSINKFFIHENQLLKEIRKITHLPAIIVQGRYDMICRAKAAYALHNNWPGSELIFVKDAGHSANEPGTAKALRDAMDKMRLKD